MPEPLTVGDPTHDILTLEMLRDTIGKPAEFSEKRMKFTEQLTETQIQFIEKSPFCLLGTVDKDGIPSVSPKGDGPGFVHIVSPELLLLPERPGNKLIFSLQNILQHPQVQLLFLLPNTCETLRVSGVASLNQDPGLCERCAAGGQPALLVMRIVVKECYYHCAKALLRSQLWKPEMWPRDRFRVQLAHAMAKKSGNTDAWANELEEAIEGRAKDVECFYVEKVWSAKQATSTKLATCQQNQDWQLFRFAGLAALVSAVCTAVLCTRLKSTKHI